MYSRSGFLFYKALFFGLNIDWLFVSVLYSNKDMILYSTIFIVYLLLMIGVGWWYSRGIKNSEDYFLSGRRFGAFPIACTLAVSFIGGGMFMGMLGFLMRYGVVTILFVLGMALSFIILGIVFGPKLRRFNLTTLPQFIGQRFNQKTRMIIAVVALMAMIGSTAVQFKASGAILNIVFNIPYFWAIVLSACVVVLYTFLGGFRSVVATDVIQIIIVFLGVLLAFPIALKSAGGVSNVIASVSQLQDGQFFNIFSQGIPFVLGLFVIVSIFAVISPENHQRIYASRDPKTAKKGGILGGIFFFITLSLVFLIGIVGLVFYPDLANPDTFFPKLAVEVLPVWLGGILLAAVAAGIMSSADTALVTASSIMVTDFYQHYRKKEVSQKKMLKISKLLVISIGIVGFVVAFAFPTVADLVIFYNSLLASVALAPIVFGLFWRRASKAGAFYGGLSGGIVNIGFFVAGVDPAVGILPSVVVACIVLVVLSLKKRSYESSPASNMV